MYELTVLVRNKLGVPTGKTETIETHDPTALAAFWYKRRTLQHSKKGRKNATTNKRKTENGFMSGLQN